MRCIQKQSYSDSEVYQKQKSSEDGASEARRSKMNLYLPELTYEII
jgi:hypothetical protein